MINKPILDKAVFTFYQECNCNGSTGNSDDSEEIEITIESACDSLDKNCGFFVIKTKGWSINNKEEFLELFERIKNIKYEESN